MFEETILSRRLVPAFKPKFHRVMKQAQRFSMVSKKRMQSLWRLLCRVERDRVPGDYVELGAASGGTGLILCAHARDATLERQVWMYDAFEEFDPPSAVHREVHDLLFEVNGFDPGRVHLVKGFFDATVGGRPPRPIALLHIDASGYEAVRCGLDLLESLVSPGGWLVFDNYGVDEGVRRAVHESLAEEAREVRLKRFGHTQAYFQCALVLRTGEAE